MSTSKKDITKLLLKGCDCGNCSYSHADSTEWWCKNQKRKPRKGVCIAWEKLISFDSILPIIRHGYPNLIANDLVTISTISDTFDSVFKTIYEQRTDKETSEE